MCLGRTHDAPYRGYGYLPLRFVGEGGRRYENGDATTSCVSSFSKLF